MVVCGWRKKAYRGMAAGLGLMLLGIGLNLPCSAVDAGSFSSIPSLPPSKTRPQEAAYLYQQLDESVPETGDQDAPLQGTITSIRVTRGRSQIIKFAQPIARISIANPALADVIPLGPDQLMINGKLRGVTSLIVWDDNGQEGIFDLYVENDTSELLKAIEDVAPNEKIGIRVTDDSFILTGQVSNSVILDEIRQTAKAYGYAEEKFVNLAESPVPQVVLEVKVAEATRSTAEQLKTSFSVNAGNSFTLTRLANPLQNPIAYAFVLEDPKPIGIPMFTGGLDDNNNLPPTGLVPPRPIALSQSGSNVGGFVGSFLGMKPHDPFATAWDILETSGKVTILAEPTLVCTHGRSASFLAGGEFPFVKGTDQNGSPIIEFKEFGIKLNFTPWISIRSGRIELKVAPEVSSVDPSNCQIAAGGLQVCGLSKRATQTTVELKDGESLMISGILTREEQNAFQQVPLLGDLPIIGHFFKHTDKSKSDRELVVVITPRIVKRDDYGQILGKAL